MRHTCHISKLINGVNVEDGKVSVEYDKAGCGIKFSRIGRILRVFKFYKAANKAIEINAVIACLFIGINGMTGIFL